MMNQQKKIKTNAEEVHEHTSNLIEAKRDSSQVENGPWHQYGIDRETVTDLERALLTAGATSSTAQSVELVQNDAPSFPPLLGMSIKERNHLQGDTNTARHPLGSSSRGVENPSASSRAQKNREYCANWRLRRKIQEEYLQQTVENQARRIQELEESLNYHTALNAQLLARIRAYEHQLEQHEKREEQQQQQRIQEQQEQQQQRSDIISRFL